MSSWSHLTTAEPELASAGARLLSDPDGSPGVAFLATANARGRPRIHPFVPLILDGQLWAFIGEASPKRRDLDRNGQYAIHERLGDKDEEFTVSGTARRIEDPDTRSTVTAAMPFEVNDTEILYSFEIDTALWTTWTTPTDPVRRIWHPSEG